MQRQKKTAEEMLRNLKSGDIVVTTGGIVGTVAAVDDDTIVLRVKPDNLKLQFARSCGQHARASGRSKYVETLAIRHRKHRMQRNLMIKTGVIVATMLACIFGVIGFPSFGAESQAAKRIAGQRHPSRASI